MTPRPPSSPLFPYTTLFRSACLIANLRQRKAATKMFRLSAEAKRFLRSEEHTSELQSQFHLLYRLLFFNDTAPPEFSSLSLHDALPICMPNCQFTSEEGGHQNVPPIRRSEKIP